LARVAALQLGAWAVGGWVLPLASDAATINSVCSSLEDSAHGRNSGGAHAFDVVVSPPGFDSWCTVTVRVQSADHDDSVDYVWLKDASTTATRRIFAAKKVRPASAGTPAVELTQQLKQGYQVKPMAFCRVHGLYEGAAFTVDGRPVDGWGATSRTQARPIAAVSNARAGTVTMAAPLPDVDALLWTVGLILAAYASGYASEGYEPHRL